ncbi:Fidgetin-like protein 1 [Frankliniella fusca]|uniref:Fidgetin-like protein 1 n=1 Tax=Frankliniella fusca TaxID=407009 RepID=A0AAE1HC77_9NEOP|nr:Fidgetin-like protein 1 [Frankliniella fusca]
MIGSAIEDRFIDQIYDGCLLAKCDTEWSDIGGLEEVKKSLKEVVIDPLRRPDIFTGLRAAPKARCIASQCQSSFFNVSASKLTSKWVGDGEKNVQALFAVARSFLSSFGFSNRTMQPSVIFIDEVDSVLSKRTEKENDASKKMKTEFLVQMSLLQWITPSFQLCTTMLGSKPAVEVKLKYECEVCHRVFTDHYNAVGHICFDHLGYSKIPKSYTGRDTNCPFCHRVLHHSSYLMKHLGYHARKLHVTMSGRPGSYRGHGPELPDRRFDGRHSRQPSFPRERDRDRDYGDHYRNQHQHSYRGSSSSRARRSPSPDRDRHYDDLYRHQHHYSYRSSSSSRARRSPSPRYRASSTFRPDYDSFQRREPYHEYREYRGGSRAPHDGPEPDRRDNRYERHRHSSSSQPSHPLSRSHDGDYYRGPSSSTARHSRTRSRSPCSRSSTDAPPPRDSTRQAPEALSKAPTPMPEAIAPNWREKAIVTEEAGKIAAASLADVKAHISDSTNSEPKLKFEDFRANILSTRLRSQRGTPEHLSPMETIVLDDESIADSDKDDGDFIPNPTSKPKKQSRVNSLSLSDNQGKKGRGKGVKNKKPSKQKILDELSKSRAEIEALRTADNKVEFPDSKLNAKPTSPFSFGTKSFDNVPSSHPFIGFLKLHFRRRNN